MDIMWVLQVHAAERQGRVLQTGTGLFLPHPPPQANPLQHTVLCQTIPYASMHAAAHLHVSIHQAWGVDEVSADEVLLP